MDSEAPQSAGAGARQVVPLPRLRRVAPDVEPLMEGRGIVKFEAECDMVCWECGKCRGHITSGYTSICSEVRCQCPASIRETHAPAPLPWSVPTTEVDQLAALAPYLTRALKIVESNIARCYEDVMREAIARTRAGHAEHGTSLFTKPTEDVDRDVLEELADAIVYQAELCRRAHEQEPQDA